MKDTEDANKLDPVAQAILDQLAAIGRGESLDPVDVAKTYAESRRKPTDRPDLWRRYLTAVKQQSVNLARAGKIEILRKGEPVDPNHFKGLVKLRLMG